MNSDLITNTRVLEDKDTIQADGFFELVFHTAHTQTVILKIENVTAGLYVQPDYAYGITIPETEKALDYKNDAEMPVNIGIIGNDSTELNSLVFDYQQQYNNLFIREDGQYLSRAVIFKLADSLQKICDKRYAGIKDPYFKSYVLYSIASININVSRGENYLANAYLFNKPVLYNHNEYMLFFNAFFKGYLGLVDSKNKQRSLHNIVNTKASYDLLLRLLEQDKFLVDPTLKELVILKNLWDFYFSADFSPDGIESIVSQFSLRTQIKEHKRIADNMLAFFNKMQEGNKAPDFSARTRDGKIGSLGAFKNRWVYLNFFSTTNPASLKEMPKIAALKKTYGARIAFVSVCLDDSVKTYLNYLKSNPKYDWTIWFNNEKSLSKTAKDNYFVTGTEAYFLINNLGYLVQSPALSPSQGIEFKWNVIFKMKTKETKTGIR